MAGAQFYDPLDCQARYLNYGLWPVTVCRRINGHSLVNLEDFNGFAGLETQASEN
jgi:hypothetical protein